MAAIVLQSVYFHYTSPYAKVFESLSLHIDTAWMLKVTSSTSRWKP